MSTLSTQESEGIRRAVHAEHESQRAAAASEERFGGIAVFAHLKQSAARHIAVLCTTLHSHNEDPPVLPPAEPGQHETLIEALEAAADREERTAAIYDDLMRQTRSAELEEVLLPLWQSVSHLHLTAIADQLTIERRRQVEAKP